MLDACIVEEGREETEWEGAARMYLRTISRKPASFRHIEGQPVQDQRKPMVLRRHRSRSVQSDFQMYVNKTTFQNLSVKAVASMLVRVGAKSIRVARHGNIKDQTRWVLPVG